MLGVMWSTVTLHERVVTGIVTLLLHKQPAQQCSQKGPGDSFSARPLSQVCVQWYKLSVSDRLAAAAGVFLDKCVCHSALLVTWVVVM